MQAKLIQRMIMKYSKDEMLRDTLIGEAALALLEQEGCVTFKSVLERLHTVLSTAGSEDTSRAAGMAIHELRAEMAARTSLPGSDEGDHSPFLSVGKNETSRN